MQQNEYWLEVKGNPDYEVSNYGNIRHKKTGKYISPYLNNGYLRVTLSGKHEYVHRVVADTFFDGDHNGRDVNHIDGNKTNNFIGNLEFCTRQENIQHAWETGLAYPHSVKVVRCKFCKYRDEEEFCRNRPDWFFCADGEHF